MSTKNEKAKKKITIRFFLYILGGAFAGAALSVGAYMIKAPFTQLFPSLYTALLTFSPWISLFLCLAALLLSYIPLARARKQIAEWNGWNDENGDAFYQQTDRLLDFSIGAANLGAIVLFMSFALLTIATLGKYINIYLFFACTLAFLFSTILLSFLQRKSVEQIRILNPEKKGDALELHFKKKWLESFDEQERLSAYAASYKAFSSLGIVFYVTYIVLFLLVPFFHFGFLPFLCVGCMWLVPNVVYLREASKNPKQ